MVAASKGYKAILVMPDTMVKSAATYCVHMVQNFSDSWCRQYERQLTTRLLRKINTYASADGNPANPEIHAKTTGDWTNRRIQQALRSILISGIGTGTISGAGKVLKKTLIMKVARLNRRIQRS